MEWGATNLGPGHLAKTTDGPFVVGELDGPPRERTHRLADVLGPAGEARVTEDIRGMIWTKLLVNSVFSGLGAVAGLLYEEVAADPDGRAVALAMWREGYDVGVAAGRSCSTASSACRRRRSRTRTGPTRRSPPPWSGTARRRRPMLQDLERGARTEVDVIVGGVVDRGRAHGVETPLHDARRRADPRRRARRARARPARVCRSSPGCWATPLTANRAVCRPGRSGRFQWSGFCHAAGEARVDDGLADGHG